MRISKELFSEHQWRWTSYFFIGVVKWSRSQRLAILHGGPAIENVYCMTYSHCCKLLQPVSLIDVSAISFSILRTQKNSSPLYTEPGFFNTIFRQITEYMYFTVHSPILEPTIVVYKAYFIQK